MEKTKLGQMAEKIGNGGDVFRNGRSIYDIGWWELIIRNFTAGISRAAGGLVLNLLVVFILGSLVFQAFWPQAQVVYSSLIQAFGQLTNLNQQLSSLGALQSGNNSALPQNVLPQLPEGWRLFGQEAIDRLPSIKAPKQ